MKKVFVNLKERSYEVVITEKVETLKNFIKKGKFSKFYIITDKIVGNIYLKLFKKIFEKYEFLILPIGEKTKNINTIVKIYQKLLEAKINRDYLIIALGGGVIGDIAGFTASTFMRGIPYIQVPTTLLGMVDSAIGGKVGIDLPWGKNLVGSFYQPRFVWINPKFLKSLPEREKLNGLAEVIKYGVIGGENFFSFLETLSRRHWEKSFAIAEDKLRDEGISLRSFAMTMLEEIIYRCVKIKAEIVQEDEKETKGKREILNFGHTIAHGLETYTKYKYYTHGEAVSIGMLVEAKIAESLLGFKEYDRLENLIKKFKLPMKIRKKLDLEKFIDILYYDKKIRDGKLRFALPEKIGKAIVVPNIKEKLIKDVIKNFLNDKMP